MSDCLCIAVVGLGNMGSAHANSLYEGLIPGAKLSAVCDVDSARLAWARENLPGVETYDDYDALLADGIAEAVVIATPHFLHPPMAIAAFEKGFHVLTEKPGGVQLSAVQAMCDAAKASGKVFGIMFNQRTHPLFQKARELVQSGALGEIKRLQWTVTNWYRTQGYYESGGWRASWAGEGGGVLMNQAPHQLDLWQWIMGVPVTIWAHCDCGKYHHIEVEDDATIFATYANGATATFITTTGEYPGTNRLEIAGDLGKLVLENGKLHWWKLPCHEREFCFSGEVPGSQYEVLAPEGKETAHNGILSNFTAAILYGEPLLSPGCDAVGEAMLSNAAYLSAWTGETVTLPLDTARFDELLAQRVAASQYKGGQVTSTADGVHKTRWNVSW